MQGWISCYSGQVLDDGMVILYNRIIYVPLSLFRVVIDFHHFYIKHLQGVILSDIIQQICYWKVLVMQFDMLVKLGVIFLQIKKFKNIYGHFSPNNIKYIKLCSVVHVDLVCTYFKPL